MAIIATTARRSRWKWPFYVLTPGVCFYQLLLDRDPYPDKELRAHCPTGLSYDECASTIFSSFMWLYPFFFIAELSGITFMLLKLAADMPPYDNEDEDAAIRRRNRMTTWSNYAFHIMALSTTLWLTIRLIHLSWLLS